MRCVGRVTSIRVRANPQMTAHSLDAYWRFPAALSGDWPGRLRRSHRPCAAYGRLVPDDSWLLSVTVSGLVAMVIIADDTARRRSATPDTDG